MATIAGRLEMLGVCLRPVHLKRTIAVALIVGTVLFCINQVDVVATGHASAMTWLKVGLTYLVPFCVSNYGVVVGHVARPRVVSGR